MACIPAEKFSHPCNKYLGLVNELTRQYGGAITLGNVPTEGRDAIVSLSIDASVRRVDG